MNTGPRRGRGATTDPPHRFEHRRTERDPDLPPPPATATRLHVDRARSVLSFNRSPDIALDRSVNPYRGCEHGCVYCYARPNHAWLELSPGLDFETEIFHKPDAPERLADELARPGYRAAPVMLGASTDAWQPLEARTGLTRRLLSVLLAHRHPVSAVTKSTLVLRDTDLLVRLARRRLASVCISLTTLDPALKRDLEPRAAGPQARLATVRALHEAGVPVGVLVAPVIPGLTDHELESLLQAAADAGAGFAGYTLLRLPHEVRPLFEDWLHTRRPLRASRVLSLLRQSRDGRLQDAAFGRRMRGSGPLAALLERRFERACRRLGLATVAPPLDCAAFRPPGATQLRLL